MPRPGIFTPGMINTILNDVENHKGKSGKYVIAKHKACTDVATLLAQVYPSSKKTGIQIERLLEKLWTDNRIPSNNGSHVSNLYRYGRSMLGFMCNEDLLLRRDQNGEIGLRIGPIADEARAQRRELLKVRRYARESRGNIDCLEQAPESFETCSSRQSPRSSLGSHHLGAHPHGQTEIQERANIRTPNTDNGQDLDLITRSPPSQDTIMNSDHLYRAIDEYLETNPERFLPCPDKLKGSKNLLMQRIDMTVCSLLETNREHLCMTPQIYAALSSVAFQDICKRIYGASSRTDILKKHNGLQSRSVFTLNDFLRAIIAAAIHDWVFEGRHASLPFAHTSKTEWQSIFEDVVSKVCPQLRQRVALETNHTYINSSIDYGGFASDLAHRFVDAMTPFVQNLLAACRKEYASQWYRNLLDIFELALRLKAQVSLRGQEYAFRWPRAGDTYDRKTMMYTNRIARDGGNVHVALFPALVQEIPEERTIFPAHVILQSTIPETPESNLSDDMSWRSARDHHQRSTP